MDIYMGDTLVTNIYDWGPDYSAIQWPCDSGFHIPSTAERTAVLNIVWTSWDDYFTYLHIPKCWYRDRKTTNIITTYWFSRYWTHNMSAKDKADCWGIEANNTAQMYADDKPANWYPIRAFKDAPVAPDSSWTETMSGKVWYNATLWLISIKNWSEWITMQDKNVWATVVYNNGDTVSNSNAGSFFQFWNYYWFPYSGTLSTYTSLQNTTGYWWQNPYSDNHFVKINSNNWFSNTNNDIWGWVTWVIAPSEIQEIYEWDTKVRPYSPPYTPWANTLYYFPFSEDALDKWSNWYSLSSSWTQETIGRRFNTVVALNKQAKPTQWTASVWMNMSSRWSWYSSSDCSLCVGNLPWYFSYKIAEPTSWGWTDRLQYTSSWPTTNYKLAGLQLNTWYHLAWTYSTTTGASCWINWTKYVLSNSTRPYTWYGTSFYTQFLTNGWSTKAIVILSEAIAEDTVRTDQQISDYFNATKATYWVS